MKNISRKTLKQYRPKELPISCIDYCLECLYKDNEHFTTDSVTKNLTYEEVIGALLLARDIIIQVNRKKLLEN